MLRVSIPVVAMLFTWFHIWLAIQMMFRPVGCCCSPQNENCPEHQAVESEHLSVLVCHQLSEERQERGRSKKPKGGGGGENLTRRPPRRTVSDLPHVPPYSISLSKSLREIPRISPSETAFGGSRKMASDGPSSRGLAFRYVPPPS